MGWLCHFHRTKEGRRRWKTSNTTRVDTPLSHSSLTHSMALVTMNATDSLVIRKKKESKCLSWTTSPYFYEMVGFVLIKMLSFYLYTMDLLWFRLRLIFEAFSYNPSWLDQNRCCMMSLLDLSACSSKWECVFWEQNEMEGLFFERYKHFGQFAPLGGEQAAAQLPGDWISIGHSTQWLWYSVYAR